MPNKIVIATGGFDPCHEGHIEYLKAARRLGDMLIVGLNSDEWLIRKKGKAFLKWDTRASILRNLHFVDYVMEIDDDDGTAIKAIRHIKGMYPNEHIIFANGGDRTATNIPEMSEPGVEFVFGVGGENKANSSSTVLKEWKEPLKVERPWGYWQVLNDVSPNIKVKLLVVNPGCTLSDQKHQFRNEFWIVKQGKAFVRFGEQHIHLEKGEQLNISVGEWHQLMNLTNEPLEVFEVQYGEACVENDIERRT